MKNLKIKFNYNCLILIVYIIVILVGNKIALSGFSLDNTNNKYMGILLSCIFVALIKKLRYEKTGKKVKLFTILWVIFCCLIWWSKKIHDEINYIDLMTLLIIVPIFFFKQGCFNIENHITLACLINLFPLILVLKSNNTLGILITFVGIVCINHNIRKMANREEVIQYILMVGFFALLIFATKSRTAFVTFIVVSIINYIYIIKQNKLSIRKIFKCFLIILLIMLLSQYFLEFADKFLFGKYIKTRDNITSGRMQMWEGILSDDITLLGNGKEYFLKNFHIGDAHNVYFQILGHYGVIALAIYIIISIYIVAKVLKKKRKLECINFFLGYFMIGMFENIFIADTRFIMCNLLFFTYISILLKNDEEIFDIDEGNYLKG